MWDTIERFILREPQNKDISLRDYQLTAKQQIFFSWKKTFDVLYQMPTGTGKTRLFTSIIRDIILGGYTSGNKIRILIIAHRSELIEQISESLNRYHIHHGILAGSQPSNRDLSIPVQVASIQTLTHPSNSQLAKALGFDFIFIDEAHHCVATTYKKLWKLFPESYKLGVTATPWRMNGQGFKHLFEAFIPSMQIREFIAQGWLAPYDYYSVKADSEEQRSINSMNRSGVDGDYLQSELEDAFDRDRIRTKLFNSYQTFAKGKRGIIYSISKAHSEHICEKYESNGVSIASIDSSTPTQDRKEKVNAFRRGDIQVLVNVDIFSEGFDCPELEFIQLARPTRSLVKYLQQVGRGLRRNGEKRCIIIDNVGLYQRFGLPDRDRDWRVYYEGLETGEDSQSGNTNTRSSNILEDASREFDIVEGDEEMVMIQSADSSTTSLQAEALLSNPNESSMVEETLSPETEKEDMDYTSSTEDVSVRKHSSIVSSKPFFSKKYIIEEEGGEYRIRNIKTGNVQTLISYKGFLGGEILLEKEKETNRLTILRRSKSIAKITPQTIIVGYVSKRGGLAVFSSFNSAVTDLVITV